MMCVRHELEQGYSAEAKYIYDGESLCAECVAHKRWLKLGKPEEEENDGHETVHD